MAGGTRLLTKLGAAALGFATLLAGEAPAQTAPTASAAVEQAPASSPASPAQNSAKDETGPKKTPLPKALDAKPRDSATPPTREVRVETFLPQPFEATPGFSGPSGVLPTEEMPNPRPGTNLFQLGLPPNQDPRFLPIEDRWRLAPSAWDRYGRGFRDAEGRRDDYQLIEGHWWDPYNQNVLKGDYPILGNHIFMNLTAANIITAETRQVPTATTPFESTRSPRAEEFFGSGVQFFYNNDLRLTLNLFQGEGAFKPFDWNVQLTPVMNFNAITVKELAQVVPDVRRGVTRERTFLALEEYFVETKIADLSEAYDFMSFRAGSQFFVSDFRGFIFSDTNRGFRLFGNNNANRDQFNAAVFLMAEKDTNSGLNTFNDRKQQVLIANYYRQDFIVPGYTAQASFHYNRDGGNFKFDKNNNLVRPDPAGVFAPHNLDICYLGLTGDGHIGRYNITNAFYWAFGRDSLNPLAGRGVDVSAYMAAIELSYDRDWARFRSSFFFSSGDGNISNDKATGFDSILDNPQFAGGQFSYWQRQQIRILGLAQVNRNSLIPDLRSSKLQGQANFVNPGLHLFNLGMDMDLTPKLRSISNVNWLFFDKTNVLEQFVFQGGVERYIGTDISTGIEYRPRLSNNIIFLGGVSTLIPGTGFRDVFNRLDRRSQPLLAAFFNLTLAY